MDGGFDAGEEGFVIVAEADYAGTGCTDCEAVLVGVIVSTTWHVASDKD